MRKIESSEEACLTQSFRFGPEIAEAASQVLRTLGEKREVRGDPAIQSAIVGYAGGGTVLARTNATVMVEVLAALATDQRPHVVGDIGDLKRLVGDVFELKEGRPGACPEFFGFTKWQEVVEFAGTEEGEDLKTFVSLSNSMANESCMQRSRMSMQRKTQPMWSSRQGIKPRVVSGTGSDLPRIF
jgi:hypothetical protein